MPEELGKEERGQVVRITCLRMKLEDLQKGHSSHTNRHGARAPGIAAVNDQEKIDKTSSGSKKKRFDS